MFRDPALEALRNWIEAGHCRLHSREDALEELRRVLAYRQFGLSISDQVRILENYQKRARILALGDAAVADLPACQDADDQKFLELSVEANATYLVTRDRALLKLRRHHQVRRRLAILTPERFLSEILTPVAHPALHALSPEICRPPRRHAP
jgi:predicted nucleic acid-binding protein